MEMTKKFRKKTGVESNEHYEYSKYISKFFNGSMPIKSNNKSSNSIYVPDVETYNKVYEIELVLRKAYINNKFSKINSNKLKVLVIALSDDCYYKFDEILLIDKNNKISKIK